MARKLIGTGVTDANGEATITYTGTGAGKLNIVAESGTFVSQPTTVWDCLFYDSGTSGIVNSMWIANNPTYLTVSSTNDGLVISNSHTTNDYYIAIDKGNPSTSITDWIDWKDFVFEFEMVEKSNTSGCSLNLRPESSTAVVYYISGLNVGDIFRAEYKDGVVKLFKNNVQIGSDYQFNVGELTSIRFTVGKEKSFTIKNVKIYSI